MSPAALEKMESEAASANNSQTDSAAATVDPSEARFSEFCKVFFFFLKFIVINVIFHCMRLN